MSQCLDSIVHWMRSNRLQLNTDKTEVMWCASTLKLPQLPSHPLSITGAIVCPVNTDRDLGVFIDNDLVAVTHVCRTVSRCFAALRQLRHLRRYVTASALWWCHLCTQDSTTATLSWLGFLFIYSSGSSLFSTLRLVWYFNYIVTTMSRMPLQLCTGCVYHNVLTSRWLSWRFECYIHGLIPPYLNTWVVSPT